MVQDITLREDNQIYEIKRMESNKYQADKDPEHRYQNLKIKTKKMKCKVLKKRKDMVKFPNIYRDSTNKKKKN